MISRFSPFMQSNRLFNINCWLLLILTIFFLFVAEIITKSNLLVENLDYFFIFVNNSGKKEKKDGWKMLVKIPLAIHSFNLLFTFNIIIIL